MRRLTAQIDTDSNSVQFESSDRLASEDGQHGSSDDLSKWLYPIVSLVNQPKKFCAKKVYAKRVANKKEVSVKFLVKEFRPKIVLNSCPIPRRPQVRHSSSTFNFWKLQVWPVDTLENVSFKFLGVYSLLTVQASNCTLRTIKSKALKNFPVNIRSSENRFKKICFWKTKPNLCK